MALRAAALVALVLMLVDPFATRESMRVRAPRAVLLADRSGSMSVKDAPNASSRAAWSAQLVGPAGALTQALGEADVSCFVFADGVQPHALPLPEAADGLATDIGGALQAALKSSAAGPPDAIVLLSDGRANRGLEREAMLRQVASGRSPVFCIGVGDEARPPDAWIAGVSVPRSVRAGTAVDVEVSIGVRGIQGQTIAATLSGAGEPLTKSVTASGTGRESVRFRLTPREPGLQRLMVRISETPGEWTGANNSRTVYLHVTPGESRLLVVAGQPSLELKFARRVLDRMSDLDATYLVRVASGVFRTPSGKPQGLPLGDALRRYDAVLLLNVPSRALTSAQMQALASFAEERGGGLGACGGAQAFASGGYGGSLLEAALAVTSGGATAYAELPVKATPKAGVTLVPPASDIERNGDFPGWARLPLLDGLNEVASIRAGAAAPLVTGSGAPLMVVQRYGMGRSLCLLTDATHRWVLGREATDESTAGHAAFWSGVVAWLTTPPNRAPVALETDRDVYEAGDVARVVVYVSDDGFRPVSGATVTVADGGVALSLAESAGAPGRYEGGVAMDEAGTRSLVARAAVRGADVGSDSREVAVTPPRRELADPAQDVLFLRALAEASGGAYIPADQVDRLPEVIHLTPSERTSVQRIAWGRSVPLLIALLAIACVDWFLRRWWGIG